MTTNPKTNKNGNTGPYTFSLFMPTYKNRNPTMKMWNK